MTEKFNVGDRVYDIQFGIGEVYIRLNGIAHSYPIEVTFKLLSGEIRTYTACGRLGAFHANPTLLTLPEARAKGYDVPKEKIKKTETQYCYVYTNGTISGQRFLSRKLAEECARGCTTVATIAECVFTWEEEI